MISKEYYLNKFKATEIVRISSHWYEESSGYNDDPRLLEFYGKNFFVLNESYPHGAGRRQISMRLNIFNETEAESKEESALVTLSRSGFFVVSVFSHQHMKQSNVLAECKGNDEEMDGSLECKCGANTYERICKAILEINSLAQMSSRLFRFSAWVM
jgi:hypothetical protein